MVDEGDKVDIWFRHQKGLTAMKRWIPITQWVGNARQELCSSKYDHLRKRCCEKTGCLITADGSEDVKITPEGLADYKVPPSLSYLPACEDESMSNTPDTIDNDEEKQEEETLDEDLEKPENDGKEFEDCENERWVMWTQSQRAVWKRLVYRNNSIFQRKNGKIQSSVWWWQWGLHRYWDDLGSRSCFTWLTLATCIFCWKFNQNFLLFLFYKKTSIKLYFSECSIFLHYSIWKINLA